ncbi:MAG TPA: SDR family oxidoreductase [Polyangiaceae bacterium]|nr:SDR family oxidoreductase [Polyangiaceae bacterium]
MTLVAITGASRGIGRATAFALGRRGATLALIGRESVELAETLRELAALGVSASSFQADLGDAGQTVAAARAVLDTLGTPAAVIHNAGIIDRASVIDTSPASFERQLAVNLRAPFLLTREWLPSMLERASGRLVFLGSISSTLGSAGAAAYCASKWGLVGFVKSLAEELSNSGLMAVVVLPGSVDTSMLSGSGFPPRMTPADVASTLVHYALDAPLAHNGGVIEMFGI